MNGDVVRVAVAAVRVRSEDDLRARLDNHVSHTPGHLVHIGLKQRARVLVCRRTGHPRIAVAKQEELGHSQHLHGTAQFLLTAAAQVLAVAQIRPVIPASLAASGANQEYLGALPGVFRQRAPWTKALVIGMGGGHQQSSAG